MERAKVWLASYLESDSSTRRIVSMEGQRGAAVALVFLVHYVALFSGWLAPRSAGLTFAGALQSAGFIGVDLFFVISGYLIYGMVVRKVIDHRNFAMRRIERIYPAFLVMLVLYSALAFVGGESRLPPTRAGTAMYLAENFLLLPGVFNIKPLITVAWSLSFEIFYYLAIPILVGVLRLRGWRPGARIALIALAALAWLPICHELGLWLHAKTVMFAGGMIVWELHALRREAPTDAGHALAAAAALLALPVGVAFSDWTALSTALRLGDWGAFVRQGWLAVVLPVVAYDSYSGRGPLARLFSWRPARWLGNMSYSYYLMHGLALKFLALIIARLAAKPDPAFFWLAMPAIFLATTVPSFVLYAAVERRFSLSPRTTRASRYAPA
jgi:exopolysaccharide production protein ExoZ